MFVDMTGLGVGGPVFVDMTGMVLVGLCCVC